MDRASRHARLLPGRSFRHCGAGGDERKQRTEALETPLERRAGKVVSLMAEHDAREAAKEHRAEMARIAKLDAENKAMIAVQVERWRQTRAGNFAINDKPFWQVSTFMAKQWQIRHEQGTRFVDLLLSGVPLDDRPIGHYRRPEEINALPSMSLAEIGLRTLRPFARGIDAENS